MALTDVEVILPICESYMTGIRIVDYLVVGGNENIRCELEANVTRSGRCLRNLTEVPYVYHRHSNKVDKSDLVSCAVVVGKMFSITVI